MTRFFASSIAKLVCLWLVLVCVSADDVFAESKVDSKTVLVFGDSISAAYRMKSEEGWVHLLDQRLEMEFDGWRASNQSVSGETTSGGLIRLGWLLEETTPEIVIIELGGNDGLRGYPIETIKENLQLMIEQVKSIGAIVVIAGMQLPPNYGPDYTEQFRDLYAQLAKQTNSKLVPFILDGVATDEKLMQDDGIHPNVDGQPYLLENVWRELRTVLEPLKETT